MAPSPLGLPGLPTPLWVHAGSSAAGNLLPTACPATAQRRIWLLLLCVGGCLELRDGTHPLVLQEGDCLLRPHLDSRLALSPEPASWSSLVFLFTGMDELVQGLIDMQVPLRLPHGCWARRQLERMQASEQDLNLASAMRLVAGVLANVIEHSLQDEDDDPESMLLQRCLEAIQQAVESQHNIAMIARDLDMSREYLSRLFRKHLATSPSRYLQDLRMRRACSLLRDPILDITEIGQRLGYSSAAAFSNAFKQCCGCSPSDYRSSRSIPLWEHDG